MCFSAKKRAEKKKKQVDRIFSDSEVRCAKYEDELIQMEKDFQAEDKEVRAKIAQFGRNLETERLVRHANISKETLEERKRSLPLFTDTMKEFARVRNKVDILYKQNSYDVINQSVDKKILTLANSLNKLKDISQLTEVIKNLTKALELRLGVVIEEDQHIIEEVKKEKEITDEQIEKENRESAEFGDYFSPPAASDDVVEVVMPVKHEVKIYDNNDNNENSATANR